MDEVWPMEQSKAEQSKGSAGASVWGTSRTVGLGREGGEGVLGVEESLPGSFELLQRCGKRLRLLQCQ